MEHVTELLLWGSLGALLYTYAGYPVLLWLLSKVLCPVKTVQAEPPAWPTISVLISAHNEEAVIGRRIQNLLEQDYPRECLQIIVGSDGSTDGTCEVVDRYRFSGVQLVAFKERRGKASVLNDLAARATGACLVFTDAATVFYPGALKALIGGFWRYPSAVVIGGKLELRSAETSQNPDGLYWRYEMFLKRLESKIRAGLGASGAIYAIRRLDYCRLPESTMADDLLEPMLIRLRTGGDVVLHASARAWQVTPNRVTDEFYRRVRTGGGIFHVLLHTWRLLLPQWGTVSLAYWSHKALRLLAPWFLLTTMVANLGLLQHTLYRLFLIAQASGYVLALFAGRVSGPSLVTKAAGAARYFVVLNAALAVGALKFLFGIASPTWNRTARPVEPVTPSPHWMEPVEAQAASQEHRPAA